jgi:DNA primase
VLLLAEAGIGHVVAPLGTALTVDQLRVLKRFTREIVVVFDGDAAGERAAERSLATFLEAGLWGYGAFLPAGDDPDTFVRREGREATLALVARAVPLLDFWLERAVRPETSVPERARVAQQVAQLLRKVADPFEYDMTVRRAAERLGIREELLRRPGAAAGPAAQRGGARAPVGAAAASDGESRVEEILVALMIQGETAAARVDAAGGLALFEDARWRPLAAEIIARGREGAAVDAATLLARLDEATAGRLAGRLLTEPGGEAELARIVDDCLATLRRRELRRRREALRRRIEADEARGNHAAVEQALRELSELRQAERS